MTTGGSIPVVRRGPSPSCCSAPQQDAPKGMRTARLEIWPRHDRRGRRVGWKLCSEPDGRTNTDASAAKINASRTEAGGALRRNILDETGTGNTGSATCPRLLSAPAGKRNAGKVADSAPPRCKNQTEKVLASVERPGCRADRMRYLAIHGAFVLAC